jgi:hypothetical protein
MHLDAQPLCLAPLLLRFSRGQLPRHPLLFALAITRFLHALARDINNHPLDAAGVCACRAARGEHTLLEGVERFTRGDAARLNVVSRAQELHVCARGGVVGQAGVRRDNGRQRDLGAQVRDVRRLRCGGQHDLLHGGAQSAAHLERGCVRRRRGVPDVVRPARVRSVAELEQRGTLAGLRVVDK